jgi:hypothetical protein
VMCWIAGEPKSGDDLTTVKRRPPRPIPLTRVRGALFSDAFVEGRGAQLSASKIGIYASTGSAAKRPLAMKRLKAPASPRRRSRAETALLETPCGSDWITQR